MCSCRCRTREGVWECKTVLATNIILKSLLWVPFFSYASWILKRMEVYLVKRKRFAYCIILNDECVYSLSEKCTLTEIKLNEKVSLCWKETHSHIDVAFVQREKTVSSQKKFLSRFYFTPTIFPFYLIRCCAAHISKDEVYIIVSALIFKFIHFLNMVRAKIAQNWI